MSRKYVVDFDDLCENVLLQPYGDKTLYLVDELLKWKAKVPALKLTLFTIPKRTDAKTIKLFKYTFGDWVALAPHGWAHTRGECLSWSREEALDKLRMAKDMGIDAPVFRAPAWLIDQHTYEACREMGYAVASHATFRIPATGVREYVYNHHMGRPPKVRAVHGHLTPVCGNHLYEMLEDNRLSFPTGAEFMYAHEAAVVMPMHVMAVEPNEKEAVE